MEELRESDEGSVIPGFFGVTPDNQICTFSLVALISQVLSLQLGLRQTYMKNFTDVDGIFAAHPGVVHEPHSIPELTYKEMRELAYAGFSVLHDEALLPCLSW